MTHCAHGLILGICQGAGGHRRPTRKIKPEGRWRSQLGFQDEQKRIPELLRVVSGRDSVILDVPAPRACSLVVASSNVRTKRSSLSKNIPGEAKLHLNRDSVIKGENTVSYFMFSVLITKELVHVGDTTLFFCK